MSKSGSWKSWLFSGTGRSREPHTKKTTRLLQSLRSLLRYGRLKPPRISCLIEFAHTKKHVVPIYGVKVCLSAHRMKDGRDPIHLRSLRRALFELPEFLLRSNSRNSLLRGRMLRLLSENTPFKGDPGCPSDVLTITAEWPPSAISGIGIKDYMNDHYGPDQILALAGSAAHNVHEADRLSSRWPMLIGFGYEKKLLLRTMMINKTTHIMG